MRPWARWLRAIAALAALFVAVSSVTNAISKSSGMPALSVRWMPAAIIAVWPGACRGLHGRPAPVE